MYYEERIINGVLHYRNLPSAKWRVLSPEKLTSIIVKLKEQLKQKEDSANVSGREYLIAYVRLKDMSCIDGSKLFSNMETALKWCDDNPLYPAKDYEYLIARTEYVR